MNEWKIGGFDDEITKGKCGCDFLAGNKLEYGKFKYNGVFLMNSYKKILKRNWVERYIKFENTMRDWSARGLETMAQRMDVVKTFALSRIYYVASVLPMKQTVSLIH